MRPVGPRLGALGAALALLTAMSACSDSGGGDDSTSPGGDGGSSEGAVQNLALLTPLGTDPFFQACTNATQATADELGVGNVTVYDSNGDATAQANQLDTLIQQKPDVILLGVNDSKAVLPQLRAAKEAGITIIAYNAEVTELELDGSVVVSERETSALAGEALLEELEAVGNSEPRVLHLIGNLTSESARERAGGFTDVMEAGIEGVTPEVTEIVTDYDPEKAANGLQDALTSGEIDGIFVHSDFLTSSLVPVLERADKGKVGSPDHIVLGALGGIPGGLTAIRDGWQDFTLNFPIDGECEIATRLAVEVVQGTPFEDAWEDAVAASELGEDYEVSFEEKDSGPLLSITARPVTKDEVDDDSLWANNLNE